MDKTQNLIGITGVLCLLALFFTIVDFAALTDIYHDFMGTRVPGWLNISVSETLLERTSTKLEWGFARISWFFRFAFFIFCIIVLKKLEGKLKLKPQE